MQLLTSRGVPHGMSFDLDTGPSPLAYVLSTPGNAVVVGLAGNGTWAVEVLASFDGLNFDVVATVTTPGQRRYDTKGVAAVAIRVLAWTPGSGVVSGMLAHGGLIPATNVSPVFGSFLTLSYNNTAAEPPTGNQIRFDSGNFMLAKKAWICNTTVDGVDQYYAVRHVPYGGTLLLQNKTDHLGAVLFHILAPPVDKGSYVEVPVAFSQGIAALNSQQVIIAVFNPGAPMSFATVADDAFVSPDVLPVIPPEPPRVAPVLTALDPSAALLGSPDFTLRVLGTGFVVGDAIEWNGGIEPTTFVSDTELTTGVNMATAQVVMPIPIVVVTPDGLRSNELTFDLGGVPPADEVVDDEGFVIDEEDEEDEPAEGGAPAAKSAPKRRRKPRKDG